MVKNTPKHISDLIAKGENQTLDFKFEISDAKKIAKTFVAFANTDGGTLLIGVKDNGAIAGIRTNEEVFMIDAAAKMYSKPKIDYDIVPWNIGGKQILEVTIKRGREKPYFAKEKNNNWKSFVRVNDQNFLANTILERYWKERNTRDIQLQYNREIEFLLEFLNDFPQITHEEFCQRANISLKTAENILVDLLILNFIELKISDSNFFYKLSHGEFFTNSKTYDYV